MDVNTLLYISSLHTLQSSHRACHKNGQLPNLPKSTNTFPARSSNIIHVSFFISFTSFYQ